jgi:hypothetical protein
MIKRGFYKGSLIGIAYFFSTFSVFAQDTLNLAKYYPKPRISSFEFLIGPTLVGLRGYPSPPQSAGLATYYVNSLQTKISYSFGVGFVHDLNAHFDIRVRLLWEQKGYVERLDSINVSQPPPYSWTHINVNDIKINYLTLSVIPQVLLGNKSKVNIGIGPYISTVMSAKMDSRFYNGTPPITFQVKDLNKYDLGITLNLGYTFRFKRGMQFTIQFSDNYGVTQLSDYLRNFQYPAWYNQSYALLLGIKFPNRTRTNNY